MVKVGRAALHRPQNGSRNRPPTQRRDRRLRLCSDLMTNRHETTANTHVTLGLDLANHQLPALLIN